MEAVLAICSNKGGCALKGEVYRSNEGGCIVTREANLQ